MAKKSGGSVLLHFVAWLTGVIVSLAVGFSMTGGGALNNSIPWISGTVTAFFGWVVVVITLLGVILAIVNYFK